MGGFHLWGTYGKKTTIKNKLKICKKTLDKVKLT
jgi:hypothetical protein